MSTGPSSRAFVPEHQIFWMLVKKARKRDDVGRVYLAIQAALAYGRESVEADWLMGAMMAEGQNTMDGGSTGIGAGGLAYFHWLYEVELSSAGNSDLHCYRFRRRYDDATVSATLRTASAPLSLQFRQEYEREKRWLEKKRATFLVNYRWHATAELFARYAAGTQEPPP